MTAHGTCNQENDDLPLLQGSAVKKKPPLSNTRAQVTHEIMCSRDTRCKTGELALSLKIMVDWFP